MRKLVAGLLIALGLIASAGVAVANAEPPPMTHNTPGMTHN